jgi:DNA-binding CsgD family transcriptional regulator
MQRDNVVRDLRPVRGESTPVDGRPSHLPANGASSEPAAVESGLILLDASLTVVALDEGAALLLSSSEDLEATVTQPISLPSDFQDTLRRYGPSGLPSFTLRVKLASGEFDSRIYMLESCQLPLPQPLVAVHLQKGASANDLLSDAGVRYHLTDREEEALRGIALGLTSKELAKRMRISPNTVKAFVRMIMAKMGVSTRSGIVARLLEHNHGR